MNFVAALILAATSPPTLVYVGPRLAEPKFEQAFDAAIGACGVKLDSVQRRYATLRAKPATAEQQSAQEAQVAEIARRGGFPGPEAEHQVTYEVIRALLQTRTFIRMAMAGEPAQSLCVAQWLRTQDFAPVEPGQKLPPELREQPGSAP